MVEAVRTRFGGGVVAVELFPLEARCDAVSGGDDPLQEGFRLVVCGGGIDQRVGGIAHIDVTGMLPPGERCGVAEQRVRKKPLDGPEGEGGVCGMAMTEPAAFVVERAIQGEMRIQPRIVVEYPCTLGELAEVVQVGSEGDTGRGIDRGVGHSQLLCGSAACRKRADVERTREEYMHVT